MKKSDVVAALAALAQDNRLDVFRLLVEAALCTSFSGTDISNSKKATNLNNAVT